MKKHIIILLLYVCCISAFADVGFKPINLTVGEYLKNPLGMDLSHHSFSWQIPYLGEGTEQKAYEIEVLQNGKLIWNSKKVKSSQNVKVQYGGRPFKSSEAFSWRVRFWTDKEVASDWSDLATFETGLLENSDWKGKWITSPEKSKALYKCHQEGKLDKPKITRTGIPPTYFRKEFEVRKNLVSARLYTASLGIYEVFINGKKVGNQHWGTGWTTYEKRIISDTYDITKMLALGKNTIGNIVADGWYAGRVIRRDGKSPNPKILVQIELTYKDGTKDIIVSDSSWKSSDGAFLYSDIYDGEYYDARLEHIGFSENLFDDSLWKNAVSSNVEKLPVITPRRSQPIRVCNELVPISVKEIKSGVFIFDFAQNMVGFPKLTLKGKCGEPIKIRFAEMLNNDGTMYTENYRSALSVDYYVPRGNSLEIYQPKFTFHGFRYVEVSGVSDEWNPTLDSARALVIHNDMPQTGSFVCSNPKLNMLQNNILWGQKSNFISVPTDCPQRDERHGWTGDAQIFIPTATYNMNVNAFFSKWNQDMRDVQKSDGLMPHIVPPGWDGGSPAWSDACVICPWEIYMAYGDKKSLIENYDMMKRWVDYQKNTSNNLIRPEKGFGDWLQPSTTKGDDWELWKGSTPKSLIGTAYFARTADIVSQSARLLEKESDARKYAKLAKNIRKAFVEAFVSDDGSIKSESQTAYLLPLAFDILPQDLAKKAFERFLLILKKNNYYLDTGFVGTPLLTPVLTKFGRMDLAYKMATNEGYPSWLYPINQGATTMWERWNSYSHDKGFGNAKMNSFNHYAYGAIGEWLYKNIAGISYDIENPGYKNIIFSPKPIGNLTFAIGTLQTGYGKILSHWKIENSKFYWTVEVPPNATGTLNYPTKVADRVLINSRKAKDITENVKSGTYHIEITL